MITMMMGMHVIQFDSIRFNREFDSNEIDESDESDLNLEKHDVRIINGNEMNISRENQ
jgi:hypothetical protein